MRHRTGAVQRHQRRRSGGGLRGAGGVRVGQDSAGLEVKQIVVGVLSVELSLPGARGLKDKRRLVKGLIDRTQSRFRICAAEVDNQESWRRATVAFACISNSTSHVHAMLARIADFVERQTDLVVMDLQVEIR